jgi:hypothetical protein
MNYRRKFNKYERKEIRSQQISEAMAGSGLYLYENKLNADFTLPRPTKSGLRSIGPKQQFQGDDYYLQLVRTGYLKLINVLQTPQQEAQVNEQKLILDQPEKVTHQGQVEQVAAAAPQQKLNEAGSQPQPDVLLNEAPVDDGFVIVGG